MLLTPRHRRALNKTVCGFNVLPLFFCNQKKSRNGKRKVLGNTYLDCGAPASVLLRHWFAPLPLAARASAIRSRTCGRRQLAFLAVSATGGARKPNPSEGAEGAAAPCTDFATEGGAGGKARRKRYALSGILSFRQPLRGCHLPRQRKVNRFADALRQRGARLHHSAHRSRALSLPQSSL